MEKQSGGFTTIAAATVITGVAGYFVTWLVYRQVGAATYAVFAVFWAALYLIVGGLSGIQQEVTRATYSIEPGSLKRASRARNFAVVAALAVFVGVAVSAIGWTSAVFPAYGWSLVWPLVVGTASYVLVATLSGSLYGVSQWRSLGLMMVVDGLARLLLLTIGLTITHDVVALAWLVAIPFPLSLLILWPIIRRRFVGRSNIDVGYRALTWNVSRTVVASVSTAILVSGFPLLLGITAQSESAVLVGQLVFTVTLTRAPLVVTVMSLQSYFVIRFRDQPERSWRLFAVVQFTILVIALIGALLGWWLGPTIFMWLSGGHTQIGGSFIAILVASSALVGALCVSAPAVLARSNHLVYSLGWVAAAVATIVTMMTPFELLHRVGLALLVGPAVGLAVHVSWLLTDSRAARHSTSEKTSI